MPITNIKKQFIRVIQHSQRIDEPKVDKLFDKWLDAKRDIIEAWGGKYIIEVPDPICFELEKDEKRSRLNEFINVVYDRYDNEELAEFLEWASIDEIFHNKLERDFYLGGDKKIPAGTKIIRAFKYFESNEQILRELQDRLSMILQEDKIVGKLCFSVHPLDFLSASENNYHWRSCHALDGDYRAGNLSYMLDRSTIMCYLKKPGELVQLPNFPEDVLWNSKKWRMWVFLSDRWDALFAGRQYPFFSRSALDLVQKNLLFSLKKNTIHWSDWHDDYIASFKRKEDNSYGSESDLDGRHISMNYNIYKMRDLVSDCEDPLHFNDLLESSCYIPYYCWDKTSGRKKPSIHFTIGHSVPCLCCDGKHSIYRSNSVMCDPCELTFGEGSNEYFAYCDHCDTRQIRDSLMWIESADQLICKDCYTNLVRQCEKCGYAWFETDLIFDREIEQWICPWCQGQKEKPKPIFDDWFDLPF